MAPAWHSDSLDRKRLADYLTKAITGRVASDSDAGGIGITVAIDADWGAGKTFFVKEWMRDLRDANHPVVYFDAWENDIGDQASIALMSAVRAELDHCLSRSTSTKRKKLVRDASNLTKQSVKSLRHVVMPVTGVIAKGLVKKVSGVAVDEIVDLIQEVDDSASDESSGSTMDKALDTLFDRVMKEHQERKNSLSNFKKSVESLLALIRDEAGAALPLFIFVDELDRCRPTYAIKLLEEIKHIFGMRHVVFVVSTNIDQLQSAVRAVYGGEFDGRRYLRRMFTKEYVLPEPTLDQTEALSKAFTGFLADRTIVDGLPLFRIQGEASNILSIMLDAVVPTDIRAQKQIIGVIEDVHHAIPQDAKIHLMWLIYLCSLYCTDRKKLELIASGALTADVLSEVRKTLRKNTTIKYNRTHDRFNRAVSEESSSLAEALAEYVQLAGMSQREIKQRAYEHEGYRYPQDIAQAVADDVFDNRGYPAIATYPRLTLLAGAL